MKRRFELTIDVDYIKSLDWGLWEGIRELIQNAYDSHIESQKDFFVYQKGNSLFIENKGQVLPEESLLIGYSSKRDNKKTIGQFGEGLKFGCLALLTNGYPIQIKSGNYLWTIAIENSQNFANRQVMVFYLEKISEFYDGCLFEVENITKQTYDTFVDKFLFLDPDFPNEKNMLLLEKKKPTLYCKGIFVAELGGDNYVYSYNLIDIKIDRDRKMYNPYTLQSATSQLWAKMALKNPKKYGELFYEGVASGKNDFCHRYSYYGEPTKLLVKIFRDRYGKKSFPVSLKNSSNSINSLRALGYKPISIPHCLAEVLWDEIGSPGDIIKKEGNQVVKIYQRLQKKEKANLEFCYSLLFQHKNYLKEKISVVNFKSKNICGLYDRTSLEIFLSKRIVKDRFKLLCTLIHELAHHISRSSDGNLEHIEEIEEIWKDVAQVLFSSKTSSQSLQPSLQNGSSVD